MRNRKQQLQSRTSSLLKQFQFSVRSLMICVLVVGACLGLLAAKIHRKQRERRAVAVIENLGGFVEYDWQDEDGNGTPPGPKWLRAFMGDDFFANVASVNFERQDRQVGDEDLTHLDLGAFTDLKGLYIRSDRITERGLARLEGMTELESVWLGGVWRHGYITDASVACFKKMHRLKYVRLTSDELTDAGAATLGQIMSLKTLYLFCTSITDTGLKYIGQNTSLEDLLLCSAHITDEGLVYLRGLKSLHQLTLQRTHVTSAGIATLLRALPNCNIRTMPDVGRH